MVIRKKFLLSFCCFLSVIFIVTTKVSAAPSTQRYGGNDRYETSVKISQNNWIKSDYIILVSGEDFPDALSAAPLSKKYNAPILLTQHDKINNNVMEEIKRLNAKNAFIIGGTGAVSENVENGLSNSNITCTRICGEDRYETSLKVAETVGLNNGVFIASGENFPDAVSAAPIAASKQMPILLTTQNKLPDNIKNFLNNNNNISYVIGGQGSVSSNSLVGINNYKRLSGTDRYETNTAVINEFFNSTNINNVYLANGEGFADALSGSAAAAKISSPIVLVSNSYNTKNSIIRSNLNNISQIYILGGNGVISDILINRILNGKSIKICIDPGHGGYDSGAVGPTDVLEKNVNLAIALKAGKLLEQNGVEVVYTRTSDSVSWPSNVGEDLQERCDIANNENIQYFVSIHANSAESSSAKGTETYYVDGSASGMKLAQSIQTQLINATGLLDRGIKTANFYVIKNTTAPAVLLEIAFISNSNEENLLNNDSFQNKVAQAITTGILNVASVE